MVFQANFTDAAILEVEIECGKLIEEPSFLFILETVLLNCLFDIKCSGFSFFIYLQNILVNLHFTGWYLLHVPNAGFHDETNLL